MGFGSITKHSQAFRATGSPNINKSELCIKSVFCDVVCISIRDGYCGQSDLDVVFFSELGSVV